MREPAEPLTDADVMPAGDAREWPLPVLVFRAPADTKTAWWRRREQVAAAGVALGLHVLLAVFLLSVQPRTSAPAPTTELLFVLDLAPPPLPSLPDPDKTRVRDTAPITTDEPARPGDMQATIVIDPTVTTTSPRPLVLGLPPDALPLATDTLPTQQPWDRRPALETETTQFAASWAPDGNAADELAFRSETAAFVLGMFRPIQPCSEKERGQRSPRCVPDNAPNEGPLRD